ncbi:MAG TPA: hypothetical protein VET82_12340, partial [Candidatus Eisenbacteria bacterium]|nr:hypothetical protein [Candidatus Eisenbacteria bacterium]
MKMVFQSELCQTLVSIDLVDRVSNRFPKGANQRERFHSEVARHSAALFGVALILVGLAGCGARPEASSATDISRQWNQINPHLAPAPLGIPVLAYDEHASQVVMYGSPVPGRPNLGVTWTWDGTDWTEADHTGNFYADAMVYDGKLGRVVAFSFFQWTPKSRQWNGST